MNSLQFLVKGVRQEITENHLQLKAIIQDINACTGPLSELQNLNSAGRCKISILRKLIDKFGDTVKEHRDQELLKEVILEREQLASSMDAFKKANLKSMLAIEKISKEDLLNHSKEKDLKQRLKRDKESMVKMSSNVTDQLLGISKQLADTTKQSAQTLETLAISSQAVFGTQEELKNTSGIIGQSGKLLKKYGRRELTDKILTSFAFAFFIGCVVYIVQKRLF
ncbi:vesicle transport protein SEC20 [Anthonomus grandis grandis]|uniref:vesicle transport protein SEC20 n=1 Tax=Anthonomus grandis grandis TaxID=2921223 RepID=UPI00216692BE|nr:vesicle transport protein SEC20 [Anthonomus grandis grandis]